MTNKRENNFTDAIAGTAMYERAIGMEFRATWGQIKQFENQMWHLYFTRCQTAHIDSELQDLNIRRQLAISLAGSVLSSDGSMDMDLTKWWGLIGVETCSNRIADTICTLYDEAPTRTFSMESGVNEAFETLYTEYDVNTAMGRAYRYALFTNIALLWPDFENRTLKVLTPDWFRLEGKDDKIHRVWILTENDKGELEYQAWTDTEVCYYNSKGDEKTKRKKVNPYGRIPGTFLKLNPSNDLYGAGITEAAELNAWANVMGFLSSRISVFQSYSVALVTNMEIAANTKLGPGYVLKGKNVGGDPSQSPDFKFVTPDGKFLDLETHRKNRVKSFEHNNGLPGFMDEMSGTPPTGIALTVLERPLNKKRKQHQFALVKAERDLAHLLGMMEEQHSITKRSLPVDDKTFAVSYAQQDAMTEPSAELELDLKRAQAGFLAPSQLVQKHFGVTESDELAAKRLATNKKFFSTTNELRSTVGGAQALQSLIIAYESTPPQISREAGIQQAVQVYGFTRVQAEAMFVQKGMTLVPITAPAQSSLTP